MNQEIVRVLVVGATGSVGRLVVAAALSEGYAVRALVRNVRQARSILPAQTELLGGDLTLPLSLQAAVAEVDAIVFTHGSHGMRGSSGEEIDYGGVRNTLLALDGRCVRVALMTAIGVTKREDARMGKLETHDWKRRAERLLRASGCPYTIVRPGWFDGNAPDQHQLVLLQGDRRWAGDPSDGVVAREQIAQTLVRSLSLPSAVGKTFELVAERGEASRGFDTLFTALLSDEPDGLDAVADLDNMPLISEPLWVREELERFRKAHD
jgi:uncharacterized protein YbjT (DUF2867 family)